MSAWGLVQTLPDPPAPGDTNAVLLYFATLATAALAWLVRRILNDKDGQVERAERARDEMTPLLREQTQLLKGVAEGAERRDADMARHILEIKEEIAELRQDPPFRRAR